jgi:hypothetical protein
MGVTMTLTTASALRTVSAILPLAALLVAPAASAQTTLLSSPLGVMTATVPRGLSGLALPLIAEDVFVGTADSNAASVVTLATPGANVGALLTSGSPYYFEVLTGAFAGERLDVDVEATIASADASVTLLFGPDTYSTLPALAAGALVGARCAVRPHVTLATLQPLLSPGLVGRDHALFADGVRIFEDGQFAFYYLREDGATWSRHDEPGDFRDKVLPPDAGLLLEIKSAAQTWLLAGRVRTNAFRKNLNAGFQSFASGFPIDLSPAEVRAFVDPAAPAGTRWTGSNVFIRADSVQLLFKQRRPLDFYYLRGDGVSWRQLTSPGSFSEVPILGATDMILLRRNKPNPGFLIPLPFGL